jgi:hypothetical protein
MAALRHVLPHASAAGLVQRREGRAAGQRWRSSAGPLMPSGGHR